MVNYSLVGGYRCSSAYIDKKKPAPENDFRSLTSGNDNKRNNTAMSSKHRTIKSGDRDPYTMNSQESVGANESNKVNQTDLKEVHRRLDSKASSTAHLAHRQFRSNKILKTQSQKPQQKVTSPKQAAATGKRLRTNVKIEEARKKMEFDKMVKNNKDTFKAILDYNKHFLKESTFDLRSSSESSDDQQPPEIIDSEQDRGTFCNQIKPFDGVSKAQKKMNRQFPNYETNQFDVMYERAMRQLKQANKKRSLEDDEVNRKNILNLVHFHIEAFDDQIALNKISPQKDDPMDAEIKKVGERDFINLSQVIEEDSQQRT